MERRKDGPRRRHMAMYEDYWPRGTRERLAFDILALTGLRKGDAMKLGWGDVDAATNEVIRLRTEKTKTPVFIPMTGELIEALNAAPLGKVTWITTPTANCIQPEGSVDFSVKPARRQALTPALMGSGIESLLTLLRTA